jgi:hypothetical protein
VNNIASIDIVKASRKMAHVMAGFSARLCSPFSAECRRNHRFQDRCRTPSLAGQERPRGDSHNTDRGSLLPAEWQRTTMRWQQTPPRAICRRLAQREKSLRTQ